MSSAASKIGPRDTCRQLEHLFDAIAIIDSKKNIKYANERFRKLALISDPTPLTLIDVTEHLEIPDHCWDSLQESPPSEVPRIHSVPFIFKNGSKGFAQFFADAISPLALGFELNPSNKDTKLFLCVLHDITFEIQGRTQLDENEKLIAELRRRHTEAQFLWRLSTETPYYLEPAVLLNTIAKKLKDELGFEEACFLKIPETDNGRPEPFVFDGRVGSRLRAVSQTLIPIIKKKMGRNEVFSEDIDLYGTFWITSFRPKLEKPFFLLARSEKSARDSNRRPLLEPLATQITAWLDNRSVYLSSITDSLTGLFNRRHFDSRFAVECLLARERQVVVSLVLIDIDFFKKINDSFGHQIGDIVLKTISKTLKTILRTSDIIARVGGEEFAALLFDTTPEDAMMAAEKIRKGIEDTPIPLAGFNQSIHVTVSLGIAGFIEANDTPESVYGAADAALYKAKGSGRNCIVMSDGTTLSARPQI